ncbi:MAG: amino acid permease [Verrucomicrobia bacterium]|nr:amino acid permease [Verrucomicrobiota bacterium]
MRTQKLGFWALTSLVAGSQIGTGIFLLPANLAVYGGLGLFSWLLTGTGALLLAMVFARLSREMPKTGGPHTFIEAAFGKTAGFFAAWTYWVISWFSSSLVVVAIVSYLSPLLGPISPFATLALQLFFLALLTILNLSGIRSVGFVESILTILKLLPLLIVPIGGLFFINKNYFNLSEIPSFPVAWSHLTKAALLTFWGFIGVETATAPAETIHNPHKTIPRALITGTAIVLIAYVFSSSVVMGVVPPLELMQSKAPFATAAEIIFGGNWHLVISIAASIVCVGTLNAWVFTSGQIALGAAYDGYFPSIFAHKNRKGAPVYAVLISSLGIVPVLFLAMNQSLGSFINFMIDVSVTAFLFIYSLCVISYLKLFWKKAERINLGGILISIGALTFCSWILISSDLKTVGLASLISLTGVPLYLWRRKKTLSPA